MSLAVLLGDDEFQIVGEREATHSERPKSSSMSAQSNPARLSEKPDDRYDSFQLITFPSGSGPSRANSSTSARVLEEVLIMIEGIRPYDLAMTLTKKLAEEWINRPSISLDELFIAFEGVKDRSGFADLVAALGVIDLGPAMPRVVELLQSYKTSDNESLREAAEDALDLIEFNAETE